MTKAVLIFIVFLTGFFGASFADGGETKEQRFVCTRYGKTNVRHGPNTQFLIKFVIESRLYPLVRKATIGSWYLVEDYLGNTGWISSALTKTKCNSIIKSHESRYVPIFKYFRKQKVKIADINPGSLVKIIECRSNICRIRHDKMSGWVEKEFIWGGLQV